MDLLEQIQLSYGSEFKNLKLLRDWIGQVYEGSRDNGKYIVKVFRNQYTNQAIQSAKVMTHLKHNQFPVPKVIMALDGSSYITYKNQIVILYEFIEGNEVEKDENLFEIGAMCGRMSILMETYPHKISAHGYDFFIKRYLEVMKKKEYEGLGRLAKLGDFLWSQVLDLPLGVIHGDFHTGNMFLQRNELILFDFDACAIASPAYDVATACDATDYFDLSLDRLKQGLRETQQNVEKFLEGYGHYATLSKPEVDAIYLFIAIRHFDIQATIIESQGLNCIDDKFLDSQYLWLSTWMKLLEDEHIIKNKAGEG